MFKKNWSQNIIFSLPLDRELTSVLITKVITIFTLLHFYFSSPVAFDSDHLFGQIQSNTSIIF